MRRDCETCRFYAVIEHRKPMFGRHTYVDRHEPWCSRIGEPCMNARALPTLVDVLDEELDLPLFHLIDGQCGIEGRLWERKA